MRKILATTAIVTFMATAASAQLVTTQVVQELESQGYTNIEIKTGATQVKIEATRGGQRLEVTYDSTTGAIVKQEMSPVAGSGGTGATTGTTTPPAPGAVALSGGEVEEPGEHNGSGHEAGEHSGSGNGGGEEGGSGGGEEEGGNGGGGEEGGHSGGEEGSGS